MSEDRVRATGRSARRASRVRIRSRAPTNETLQRLESRLWRRLLTPVMPNVEWALRRDESGVGRLVRHPGDGKARTLDRKVEPFFREPGLVPGTIEDVGMNRHGVLRTHGVGEARHLSIGASPAPSGLSCQNVQYRWCGKGGLFSRSTSRPKRGGEQRAFVPGVRLGWRQEQVNLVRRAHASLPGSRTTTSSHQLEALRRPA